MALTLTTDERNELEARLRSRTIRSAGPRRARGVLMMANGEAHPTIETTLPCYRDYINRWRRFLAKRLIGFLIGSLWQILDELTLEFLFRLGATAARRSTAKG